MCGLAGYLEPHEFSEVDADQCVRKMSACLAHRGPDDESVWIDAVAGVAMGHRRLKVLELSRAGRQPMTSASGRYVLAYNGEFYNHLEIRKKLTACDANIAWRGHSDTETILGAFDHWGIDSALNECVGMFAFALWDRKDRVLTLARDRMGEKPLYYGWQNGSFIFGSELSALRAHPNFTAEIDRDALGMYMRRGYIEAPYSIHAGIRKLPAGTTLRLEPKHGPSNTPQPTRYWSLSDVVERGVIHPFDGSDDDAICELEGHIRRAIELQSIADVPLGAFLSGGVDSSMIVAMLQANSSERVKSFTIGFDEPRYNEAQHAKSVAETLGTSHTELYVTPREAMEVIPLIPTIYDEPFGDSSAIPTVLISRLARSDVTVSLSGDSGDELFGGYKRYSRTTDIWGKVRRLPLTSRTVLAAALNIFQCGHSSSKFCRKTRRLARYLSARNVEECYRLQTLQRHEVHRLVLNSSAAHSRATWPEFLANDAMSRSGMMYDDARIYLPDDILVKVDRAAMFASLETRVPFLDHRLVEFAWSLPMHMKFRNGEGKWILKQVLEKYVPRKLIDRPKMGFGIPVGEWLRGPLRDWAENLLSYNSLESQGYLNADWVQQEWRQHLAEEASSGDRVWQILMFQAWQASNATSQAISS